MSDSRKVRVTENLSPCFIPLTALLRIDFLYLSLFTGRHRGTLLRQQPDRTGSL
ncbi:MAG: hypothetical protein R6U41_05830 [Desulfosalsimonas sp.]|uniref:hypothetical protein n=1 Tax=Desulfosalsimonas sp. TaxID=3073848 RepID=UPI00397076C4